jgi:uncharacterized protein YndB with AHSA1/START domain
MSAASEVSTVLPAPPARAFAVLENPRSFERLVAGARRIRRFDPRWPDQGTVIHHTVGVPPLLVRDTTEVIEVEPPRLLRLEARIWPAGTLQVQFEFSPCPEGCRLVVREEPSSGPIGWPVVRDVARLAIRARNLEICRRYRKMMRADA